MALLWRCRLSISNKWHSTLHHTSQFHSLILICFFFVCLFTLFFPMCLSVPFTRSRFCCSAVRHFARSVCIYYNSTPATLSTGISSFKVISNRTQTSANSYQQINMFLSRRFVWTDLLILSFDLNCFVL